MQAGKCSTVLYTLSLLPFAAAIMRAQSWLDFTLLARIRVFSKWISVQGRNPSGGDPAGESAICHSEELDSKITQKKMWMTRRMFLLVLFLGVTAIPFWFTCRVFASEVLPLSSLLESSGFARYIPPLFSPSTADLFRIKMAGSRLILLYDGFYVRDRHFVDYNFNFSICKTQSCSVTGNKALLQVWISMNRISLCRRTQCM